MGVKVKSEEKEKKVEERERREGREEKILSPSRYPHVWNALIRVIFCKRTLIPIHSEKYVFSLGSAIQPEDFNAISGVLKKKIIIINSLRRL